TEERTDEPITISIDGVKTTVAPGDVVKLNPGQSVCYEPYLYHQFWGEGDHCLVGEVSTVNDDVKDNRFEEPKGRFPQIEEDEAPECLLCNEYPKV
ncbi:MAG: D-lyxose/D-mannose family sugar isomerase, partial [Muribaculaceae bacterium]|nr:D-lyxose/D-mannose family sugar isomerase [Muribaculaceae bacterium]